MSPHQSPHQSPQLCLLDALIEIEVRRLCARWATLGCGSCEEDCLQEVRLLLWRAREQLAALPPEEAQSYCRVCVRRAVWHVLQTECRHRTLTVSLNEECDAEQVPAPHDAVVAKLAAVQWLAALPILDREILSRVYFEGQTLVEIAEELQLTRAVVEKRHQRALARLRRERERERERETG